MGRMGQVLATPAFVEAHLLGGSCAPDPLPRAEASSGQGLTTNAGPSGVASEVRAAMLAALPSLRAFALSLTNAREIADDLVQDTLVRALAKIDQFEPGTNMGAWLFTILRNLFYSQCRRTKREIEDPDGSYAARLWAPPEQHGTCAVQDMLRALRKLPADQREVLLLIVAEGLSYEEAAHICGVAVGTIKSRVSRGRVRLAELLAIRDAGDLAPDRVTQAALQSAL
jgi:RNA polymerase sigma-70 factor, ECF subfamily